MYITQEADYAVRIVDCLSRAGVRRDARSISAETCVSLRFALKILGKLSAAGIVKSFKGNRGGYELAHEPSDITLQDVLRAVDGPYCLSRCLPNENNCNRNFTKQCVFHKTFSRLSEEMNQKLSQITFQDFLDEAAAVCDLDANGATC